MKAKRANAFSLVEVLIVIALLAGFMGVVIPNIFKTTKLSLSEAARKIAVFTDDLRFLSILENSKFYLVFDFELDEVYVETLDETGLRQRVERFDSIELKDTVQLKYFKKGSRFVDAQKAHIIILPFGYINTFEVVLEENTNQLAFRVISVLGDYVIDDDIGPFSR